MTTPLALTSPEAYQAALAELGRLFDHLPDPDTEEGRRFVELVDQAEAYETVHFSLT